MGKKQKEKELPDSNNELNVVYVYNSIIEKLWKLGKEDKGFIVWIPIWLLVLFAIGMIIATIFVISSFVDNPIGYGFLAGVLIVVSITGLIVSIVIPNCKKYKNSVEENSNKRKKEIEKIVDECKLKNCNYSFVLDHVINKTKELFKELNDKKKNSIATLLVATLAVTGTAMVKEYVTAYYWVGQVKEITITTDNADSTEKISSDEEKSDGKESTSTNNDSVNNDKEEFSGKDELSIKFAEEMTKSVGTFEGTAFAFFALFIVAIGIRTWELVQNTPNNFMCKNLEYLLFELQYIKDNQTGSLKVIEKGEVLNEMDSLFYLVSKALDQVYEKDGFLISNKPLDSQNGRVGERSIVFRFAHYLQNLIDEEDAFKYLSLDCDYNRNGSETKKLPPFPKGTYPSVILHKRGSNDKNILIMEFQPYWNKDQTNDVKKIIDFTSMNGKYKFQYGATVLLAKDREKVVIDKYVDGKIVEE